MTLGQLDALIRVHNAGARKRGRAQEQGTPISQGQWAAMVIDHG